MEKSPLTTLCYIKKEHEYLLLHRTKKHKDINKGKWIGIGGHFEKGESPEECLKREVWEETGLTLKHYEFRGIITFLADDYPTEYMCLYTAETNSKDVSECDEGELAWISEDDIWKLPMWEGDRIFLQLIFDQEPFFSLKLTYHGERIIQASLNGKPLELFDLLDNNGHLTGLTNIRQVVHRHGDAHRTVHSWLVRKRNNDWQVLLQKRSAQKDSYPNCYDISSAGHIQAGDKSLSSAQRELKEELGIYLPENRFHFIGIHQSKNETVFWGKPFRNLEFAMVYVVLIENEETDFVLQKEEVESVTWMSLMECKEKARLKDSHYCLYFDELVLLENWLTSMPYTPPFPQ